MVRTEDWDELEESFSSVIKSRVFWSESVIHSPWVSWQTADILCLAFQLNPRCTQDLWGRDERVWSASQNWQSQEISCRKRKFWLLNYTNIINQPRSTSTRWFGDWKIRHCEGRAIPLSRKGPSDFDRGRHKPKARRGGGERDLLFGWSVLL